MYEISDSEYQAYVVNNPHKFLPRFHTFEKLEGGYRSTWNWVAFFFTWVWFLYRKMYVWALVFFVVGLIPYVNFISMIVGGVAAYYLYYKKSSEDIALLKEQYGGSELDQYLAEAGGVHKWVPWVAFALFVLFVLGIVAAIAIPSYLAFQEQAVSQVVQ